MKKLQVAIFISGRGSNLESLIQSSLKKQSLVEVQLVVSNNSKAKGLTVAKKNKIPFIHFIPRKNFENRVMKYLKNIDIICLAGFMQVLDSKFAKAAEDNNISVIIAGAGGSAHLPGMIASLTTIPVIGVPVESRKLKGLDSLLSIVQMPKGIPVGSVAIGEDGAMNAGLYAASIIALTNKEIKKNLKNYRTKQSKAVKQKP